MSIENHVYITFYLNKHFGLCEKAFSYHYMRYNSGHI